MLIGPAAGGIIGSLGCFLIALPIFLVPGALAPTARSQPESGVADLPDPRARAPDLREAVGAMPPAIGDWAGWLAVTGLLLDGLAGEGGQMLSMLWASSGWWNCTRVLCSFRLDRLSRKAAGPPGSVDRADDGPWLLELQASGGDWRRFWLGRHWTESQIPLNRVRDLLENYAIY